MSTVALTLQKLGADEVDRDAAVELFDQILDVWNGADPSSIRHLITDDYQGHMLHLASGDRTANTYASWIADFRRSNPDVRFRVLSQGVAGNQVWSRLVATSGDGRTSNGMNTSVLRDGLVSEEWAIWSDWYSTA